MSGPELITLGCRLNIAESDAIRAQLAGENDLIVVNSCAVTAEAVAETRKAIRRARRARPDARLLVTGCAATIDPAGFAAMPEVDGLVDNLVKLDGRRYAAANPSPLRGERGARSEAVGGRGAGVSQIAAVQLPPLTLPPAAPAGPSLSHKGERGLTRAHIPVQTGCDHACTFCIIPAGRGPSRSLPAGAVIDAIAAAVDAGHREVVLTGVDLTSYGPDLPGAPTLGLLVERILAHVPALDRLRLSSLDGVEIDDRLFALVTQEPRMMPHLHLSLQAGDDMILKRMKRRHSRAQSVALVERLKAARPAIAIGADLIAGFPTESEAMAANTRALIADCDIVLGHIFPYSPRPGTPAARMPQVDRAIVKARAAALRAVADERRAAWLASLVGSTQRVLVERGGRRGHAENFARVTIDRHPGERRDPESRAASFVTLDSGVRGNDEEGIGIILPIRITAATPDRLIGSPA